MQHTDSSAMRKCGKVILLGVKPSEDNESTPPPILQIKQLNHSYPLQTMGHKLGKFFPMGVTQFRSYAVYNAVREDNGKTKCFGSVLRHILVYRLMFSSEGPLKPTF